MEVDHLLTPLTRREIPLLRRWIAQCPVPCGDTARLTWHLSIDDRWSAHERDSLQRLVAVSNLKGTRLDFFDTNLSPDESVYFRKPPEAFDLNTYPYGLKSGPNLQFFRSVRHIAEQAGPKAAAILLETDAYPLRDDWISALNQRIAGLRDFLVAGAIYQGGSHIHPAIADHFNGNSIYGVGSRDFKRFLEGWEAVLLHCVKLDERMAYDIALDWLVHRRDTKPRLVEGDPPNWIETRELAMGKRANISDVMINFGGAEEQRADYELDVDDFLARFPTAVIAHGKCFHMTAHRIHYRLTEAHPRAHPLNQAIDALQQRGMAEYFGLRQGAPSDLDDALARHFRLAEGSGSLFRTCFGGPFESPASP
jgi:hypothetical protein